MSNVHKWNEPKSPESPLPGAAPRPQTPDPHAPQPLDPVEDDNPFDAPVKPPPKE